MSGPFRDRIFRKTSDEQQAQSEQISSLADRIAQDEADIAVLSDNLRRNEQKTDQLSDTIIDLTFGMPDAVKEEMGIWSDKNFDATADKWYYGKVDPTYKNNEWFTSVSIRDKMTAEMALPEGIVPEDVGEVLAMLDQIGKSIPYEVAPVGGLDPGTSPVTGPTGISSFTTHFTVTRIDEINTRMQHLLVDGYGPLSVMSQEWAKSGGILQQVDFVKKNRDTLGSMSGNWGYVVESLTQIRDGTFTPSMFGTLDRRINMRFSQLQALAGAASLDTDQKTALSMLMSSAPGSTEKIYTFLDDISGMWVQDFSGLGIGNMDDRIDKWVSEGRLDAHMPGLLDAHLNDGVFRSKLSPEVIREKLDDGWFISKFDFAMGSNYNKISPDTAALFMGRVSVGYWRDFIKAAYPNAPLLDMLGDKFPMIDRNDANVGSIKDHMTCVKTQLTELETNMRDFIRDFRDWMKNFILDWDRMSVDKPRRQEHIDQFDNDVKIHIEHASDALKNLKDCITDLDNSMV